MGNLQKEVVLVVEGSLGSRASSLVVVYGGMMAALDVVFCCGLAPHGTGVRFESKRIRGAQRGVLSYRIVSYSITV